MTLEPWETLSSDQMRLFATKWKNSLKKGDVVALYGNLGAGKTTFVKYILEDSVQETVSSPTFVYLNLYNDQSIAHFDLYRLQDQNAFIHLGFQEYLEYPYQVFIEWPEIIEDLLPPHTKRIYLEHATESKRRLCVR